MADTKITGLDQIDEVALGDKIPLVDVSDTTQSAQGSTKYATVEQIMALSTAQANPAVENSYLTVALLLAGQGDQTEGYLQYVADASAHPDVTSGEAYFEYLGTTDGDVDDYRLLSAAEASEVVSTPPINRFFIADVETTTATSVTEGQIHITYENVNDTITDILFPQTFSGYLEDMNTLTGDDVNFAVAIFNRTTNEWLGAVDVSFSIVNTNYYKVSTALETMPLAAITQYDVVEVYFSWYPATADSSNPVTTVTTDTSTTFNGTQKGLNNIYRFNKTTAQTVLIDPDDYATDELAVIERGELGGSLEITSPSDVTHCGVRTIDNRFFVNDRNSLVFAKKLAIGKMLIAGNLTRGYTGAVTTSSYGTLTEGDTGVDVAVTGTGFSDNMLVTVSANATLNSFTVNSPTSLTLNMDAVGSASDTVTVTYDNGDVFVDTDAITIASSLTVVYDTYPFEYGWALFRLSNLTTYSENWRRSSDNATTDVGFDSSGEVSLSSPVSAGGTLASWLGSDDAYRVTRYNQGSVGAGGNLTQLDTAQQARMAVSGVLTAAASRTCAEFDGINDCYETVSTAAWANNDLTIFSDVRSKSATTGMLVVQFSSSTGTDRMLQFGYHSGNTVRALFCNEAGSATTVNSGSTSLDTWYSAVAVSNSTNTRVYIDGVAGTAGAALANTPTEALSIQTGGRQPNDDLVLDGYNSYTIIYQSDEESNISAIQTIIDSFL